MANTFDPCLAFTLAQEGGFTDDPKDPGGATNHGITLATLRDYADNANLGADDLRNVSMTIVQAIYGADFWNRLRCDALPAGVDLMVFDHGVNAGPFRSATVLQAAAGLAGADLDGVIGPQSLTAIGKADPATLIADLAARQRAYYQARADFAAYGDGWLARLDRRQAQASAMRPGG